MTLVRRTMTAAVAVLLIGSIILTALIAPWGDRTGAQAEPTATAQSEAPPTPTPPFSAALIAQAELGPVSAGPLTLSVMSIALPPSSVTEPFTNPGPVVIRVDKGSITLDAAEATIGPVVANVGIIQPEPPEPGPANGAVIGPGQQIVLSAGTPAQIRNDGEVLATIVVIALQTEDAGSGSAASSPATGNATASTPVGAATPTN